MYVIEPIKSLLEAIGTAHPEAVITFDPPLDQENGGWFIDVRRNGKAVVIEWSRDTFFGVTLLTDNCGFGERPDECYTSLTDATKRISELLTSTVEG